MTKKTWEKQLIQQLKPLPKEERKKILDYYKEIYGDKLEEGVSESEILAEFGSPEECAARILAEEGIEWETVERKTGNGASVAELVGLFFLSLILILPLAITAAALIISFAAVSIAGIAVSVAGIFYALLSHFFMTSSSGTAIFINVIIGLVLVGVGLVLFVGFYLSSKYLAIGSAKALTWIYTRRYIK